MYACMLQLLALRGQHNAAANQNMCFSFLKRQTQKKVELARNEQADGEGHIKAQYF